MKLTTFSHILGQDHAIRSLRQAYLADRLPHGLIFAGPTGVGKATTAAALASLFLCDRPAAADPCGHCPACITFAGGNHPDCHVITKELIRVYDKTGKSKGVDLSIHVIRPELVETAARKSSMGRGKVFIIEQAELMNHATQNAILKTLEEPIGRTLIILLTHQPHALLPTIRSRCQLVPFLPLHRDLVLRELEKRRIQHADAVDAASFAEGSLGQALQWLQDGVITNARHLCEMLTRITPDALSDLPDWIKTAADQYAQKQLQRDELSSKDQATRQALALYLHLMSQVFRQRLHSATQPHELEHLCSAIDAIARAEQYLDSNVNTALIFQQLAVTLEKPLGDQSGASTTPRQSPVR